MLLHSQRMLKETVSTPAVALDSAHVALDVVVKLASTSPRPFHWFCQLSDDIIIINVQLSGVLYLAALRYYCLLAYIVYVGILVRLFLFELHFQFQCLLVFSVRMSLSFFFSTLCSNQVLTSVSLRAYTR